MIQIRQFLGLSPVVSKPGELLDARNVRIKRGKLFTVPDSQELYTHIASEAGFYIWGHGAGSVIVAFGKASKDYNGVSFYSDGHQCMVMSILDYRSERVYQTDLSAFGAPVDRAVPAIVLGASMWVNAGGQLFEVSFNPKTVGSTVYTPMSAVRRDMTIGYEAGTASYLKSAPDSKIMCVHNGRVYYAGLSSKLHAVTQAVDPTKVSSLAALREEGGEYGYNPNQIVFSEAYQPNAIKAWSFIGIDDYQAEITGLVSYNHTLYIFTKSGLWQYSGDDPLTATLEHVPNVEGCINHRTVQVVGDTLFWVGPTGINYMGPKGKGRVSGLDVFFDLSVADTILSAVGYNITLDIEGLNAAAAQKYGYYILRLNHTMLALVDIETKAATLWHQDSIEIHSILGIGEALIGGSYCDVLIGHNTGDAATIRTFLWDGNVCNSSFVLTLPDVIERVPWRSATVLAPHVGRVKEMDIQVGDYPHREGGMAYTVNGVKPAGWESMNTIGTDWQIGTSPVYSSGTREYSARFSFRSSMPAVRVALSTTRAMMIEGVILDGGPGPVKVQNA